MFKFSSLPYYITKLCCIQGAPQTVNKLIFTMSKTNQKKKSNTKSKMVTNSNQNVPMQQDTSSNFNSRIEVLPSPVKSENDKKDYKVIRLANGLTACLISDMLNWELIKDKLEDVQSDSDAESTFSSSSEMSHDEKEEEEDNVAEDNEDCKMRKVSEVEEKMASAALCIGVGSFSDPKKVPGMAHFLEHMVFMGSEKFPQENDFDSFIKKRGGSDNASTDCETTTFYFECLEKHLNRGLDKFAQFFISPLMKRESMTREREAIDSEFQMALPSDAYRKEQLLCSFADPIAPVNTFTWGNLVTLRDNVSDDDLYNGVHEFRKRHYSAHRMTLAIQARLPMEKLESFVVECFSGVPNNSLPSDDFKQFANGVFNTPAFKSLYYLKPMKDLCQVDLTWALPSLLQLYKSKPHQYVSWILGHEGKGSLLSALRERVWALSIFTGNGETGLEHNSMYSLFTITLVLTKDGIEHLSEVIEMVFSYIKLMKNVGPQERIFKEIQLIDDTSFRFAEEESAVETVEDLAEAMQFYPPEDYVAGSELYYEYNPQAIEMVMDHLTADDVNIMVLSTTLPKGIRYDKTEPWFGTAYAEKEIPIEWQQLWKEAKPLECFDLPVPNIFLTNNFSLLPAPSDVPEYPEKILSNDLVELWYRQDIKFKLPTAYYYFHLITPMSLQSPNSACLLDMYVGLLSLLLNEEAYSAHVAELSYSVTVGDRGIVIKVDGYNEKLPLLISLISSYMVKFKTALREEMFEAYKDKLTKHYYNNFLKPSRLAKDVRMSVLLNSFWSPLDKHSVISDISYTDMLKYSENLTQSLFVQVLIQGNVSKDVATSTTEQFLKDIQCSALDSKSIPRIRVSKLPMGEQCLSVLSFNVNDTNSIITNYYQSGPATFKASVIIELLMMLLEEPLFDILRTKEQLGYNIFCTSRDTFGILGYSITVNTQVSKNTTEYVDKRIEYFVKHSMNLLKKMPEKKFNQMKGDLVQIKQCSDVHLKDEVMRNWSEISMQEYVFDRLKQEIKASAEIKLIDLRKWWDEHNSFGKKTNFRKLTVQVVGHTTSQNKNLGKPIDLTPAAKETLAENQGSHEEEEEEDACANKKYFMQFVSNSKETTEGKAKKEYYITDVFDFKKHLKLYPDVLK